ncbi:hypothetical protein RRG08_013353 [Elysia crispata]|uniref:Uncharacterized protein n=1 Tax=Elysia crispata TaxID=231223 RepID=A0AAE1E7S1_9GAST|nr:hypothetical protein RRG08_013353 [Elysia crispata]
MVCLRADRQTEWYGRSAATCGRGVGVVGGSGRGVGAVVGGGRGVGAVVGSGRGVGAVGGSDRGVGAVGGIGRGVGVVMVFLLFLPLIPNQFYFHHTKSRMQEIFLAASEPRVGKIVWREYIRCVNTFETGTCYGRDNHFGQSSGLLFFRRMASSHAILALVSLGAQ